MVINNTYTQAVSFLLELERNDGRVSEPRSIRIKFNADQVQKKEIPSYDSSIVIAEYIQDL